MSKKTIGVILFISFLVLFILMLFVLRKEQKSLALPRSVTAVRLEINDPVETLKLTGKVEAWKEEDLSFEVPGRIKWCIDKGVDIQGKENSYSLLNGDGALVAILDPEEYKLKLKAAEANLKTGEAQLNALKISVKEVVSRQLDAVKADMDNAQKEYNRIKGLHDKKVVSQQLYDTAETTYKKNLAKYKEIKASIVVKQAELKAAEATLDQLQQAVENARLDLKRTKLRIPYQGKIAEVYANVGANVKAGEKVARLFVVDPVCVKLNVSPALDRKFFYSQFVNAYPPDSNIPVKAMVNRKSAVADPQTHTFTLELLLRNRFANVEKNIPGKLLKLPRIKASWPVGKMNWRDGEEKLFVLKDCICSDEEGDFLWKIEETPDTLPGAPVYKLKKERVEFLPGEYNLLGVYDYRVLAKPGNMKELNLTAEGVPESLKSGDEVILIRRQRIFRPGDLVKIVLNDKQFPRGIYLPIKLIESDSLKHWIFKVVRNPDGTSSAKQVFVKIKERFNDWVLIESPLLEKGDLIVSDGAHFIIPDEKINVKSIEQLTL